MWGSASDAVERLSRFLIQAAVEGRLTSYPEAAGATGLRVGPQLFEVLKAVQLRRDEIGCDLSALVVSATTGLPGRGWGEPSKWEAAVRQCHECFAGDDLPGPVVEVAPAPSSGLPYDPGNAGDLLKHACLAVAARWTLSKVSDVLRYADPFAGEWDYPLLAPVAERVGRMDGTLLSRYSSAAWQRGRYLGSTGIVGETASSEQRPVEIWVGDRCAQRVNRLVTQHDCHPLPDPEDGYSVLASSRPYDLILLDPFADFLDNAPHLLSPIVGSSEDSSLLLFVLTDQHASVARREYVGALREQCTAYGATAIVAGIPSLAKAVVRGEGGYDFEVVFLPRRNLSDAAVREALPLLAGTAVRVAAALGERCEARVSMVAP
jgi:hypothetical protein